MATAEKFFEDNISRLDPQTDPIGYNLNQGLRALAQDLQQLEREQQETQRLLQRVLREVR